jgi:hypothetical protein
MTDAKEKKTVLLVMAQDARATGRYAVAQMHP